MEVRNEGFDGKAYQARFDALAERGVDIHGEARFVMSFEPSSVLDAGCGTGRVAIELARQGVEVVGVDADRSMIAEARARAPELSWVRSDLAHLDLGRRFDVVVLAGNVPLFCAEVDRPALVRSCAAHVRAGGHMIAGFALDGRYTLDEYDAECGSAGLALAERFSTWDGRAFAPGGDYAVSVHRRQS